MRDPIAAFDWLITEFRRYTRNEINWVEVREVLVEAEALREHYAVAMNEMLEDYHATSEQKCA